MYWLWQGPVEVVVLLLHSGSSSCSLRAQLLQAALRLKAGGPPPWYELPLCCHALCSV